MTSESNRFFPCKIELINRLHEIGSSIAVLKAIHMTFKYSVYITISGWCQGYHICGKEWKELRRGKMIILEDRLTFVQRLKIVESPPFPHAPGLCE